MPIVNVSVSRVETPKCRFKLVLQTSNSTYTEALKTKVIDYDKDDPKPVNIGELLMAFIEVVKSNAVPLSDSEEKILYEMVEKYYALVI